MKTLTPAVSTATQQQHVIICMLIQFMFDSGTVYVTDAGVDITWNGNVYKGVGSCGKIEEVRDSLQHRSVGLRFSLAGPISAYLSLALAEPVKNRRVDLYVGFFNPSSYVPIADPVLEWSGFMNTMTVVDNGQESEIAIVAENRFAEFRRPKIKRHNQQDHDKDFPGDKFYEFLPEIQERAVVWPAKEFFRR